MAIRQTTHILKNSDIVNRPLPSSLLPGEPIVNTADGIMYFSGVTTSTSEWTPAGTGATELTFFEVGSNLYDLRLRNRITQYEGISGVGLVGKILSGTTSGLTLVDSTNINGISAFTYNEFTNTFTIYDSNGTQYPATFTAVSGLTVNGDFNVTGTTYSTQISAVTITATTIDVTNINTTGDMTVGNLTVTGNTSVQGLTGSTISLPTLGDNRVVYTTSGGTLTTESNFTYDENTDILGVNNIEASGNVTIQGDLTVFGAAISAFTTNLYVEDPNITLNYNPTGSTTVTSVNAGFTIQDGNGVVSGDVNFDIVRMQNLTGLTPTEIPDVSEYTGPTGYENRGWITQLNDIVIRSTDPTDGGSLGDFNGVRVLAEWDVLDGGTY
jgi:hypothetical protein